MRLHRQRSPGFTLVDLLVVIAVIAVLISLLLPVLNQVRASAQAAACASNLRQTGLGVLMYASDHRRWLIWNEDERQPFKRNARRWTIGLMKLRYLPDVATVKHRDRDDWEVRFPNGFSCPTLSMEGLVMQGGEVTLNGNNAQHSFGMRSYPKNFRGDHWTDLSAMGWVSDIVSGVPKDLYGRTTRLGSVSTEAPFVADSVVQPANLGFRRQSNNFGMTFFGPHSAYIHRRHNDRANLGFIDGRV